MISKKERGLNFSQRKCKIINKSTFIPYLRSNGFSSVPYELLDFKEIDPEIILIKVDDLSLGKNNYRIKKLHSQGGSKVISLKAERKIKNLQLEIIEADSKENLLNRDKNDFLRFLPRYTKKGTPIYAFDFGTHYFLGGHYKKDIFVNKNLSNDKLFYYFLGLYFAEGGKIDASFTNSWPESINLVLNFIENNFSIKRKNVSVSICCNSNLKPKKENLEKFWTDKTGVCNFFRNLHINKNVKSPQGILQLYFSSKILKELFVNLIKKLDVSNNLDFINGFLSGDGCPILQNKWCITHHIVFDSKKDIFGKKRYCDLFNNFKFNFINKNRLVLYTNWDQNLFLLMNGAYSFNPMRRFKFLKYFLELPKTQGNRNDKVNQLSKEYKNLKIDLTNFYKSLVSYKVYTNDEMKMKIPKELK